MVVKHENVVNLPVGLCMANEGIVTMDIGSISSTVKIEKVPVITENKNYTIEINFPPPPRLLNLKNEENVRNWVSGVTSSKNGIKCYYDVENHVAWIESVGLVDAILSLVVCGIIVIIWIKFTLFYIYNKCCAEDEYNDPLL